MQKNPDSLANDIEFIFGPVGDRKIQIVKKNLRSENMRRFINKTTVFSWIQKIPKNSFFFSVLNEETQIRIMMRLEYNSEKNNT